MAVERVVARRSAKPLCTTYSQLRTGCVRGASPASNTHYAQKKEKKTKCRIGQISLISAEYFCPTSAAPRPASFYSLAHDAPPSPLLPLSLLRAPRKVFKGSAGALPGRGSAEWRWSDPTIARRARSAVITVLDRIQRLVGESTSQQGREGAL